MDIRAAAPPEGARPQHQQQSRQRETILDLIGNLFGGGDRNYPRRAFRVSQCGARC
jgi:hypothetical protein